MSDYKIVQPDLDSLAKLPNPGLHSFLNRNVSGIDQDIRTPLFDKAPRSEIIDQWFKIFNHNKNKCYTELIDKEIEESTKIGCYSCMYPLKDRINGILDYWKLNKRPILTSQDISLLNKAMELYLSGFSKYKYSLRLQSNQNVVNELPRNTNSGLPYFQKRSNVITDTIVDIEAITSGFQSVDTNVINNLPAVLGWRGQQINKQRVVWMFPYLLNILEAQYYKPRIKMIQRNRLKSEFLSQDDVNLNLTKLLRTKSTNDLVIATDFSKFDMHFNSVLQDIAYQSKRFFVRREYDNSYLRDLHYSKFKIPLLCSENIMITGNHGMSTGSTGTNMDANEAHSVMQQACALHQHEILNPHSSVLGDDGVISFPGISVPIVKDFYEHYFGQELNLEKQYASIDTTVYLQRMYSKKYVRNGICVGVYPTFRALGRLIAQERFNDPNLWNKEMVILRSLSILENCNEHPLFEQFIEFVIKNDKFQLGLKIPGFFEKFGSVTIKELEDKNNIDLSYSKVIESDNLIKGISTWSVFKYLVNR